MNRRLAISSSRPGLLARFWRANRGVAAVEMALIATPFFLLLFGIIELALVFLVSSSLENATSQAARTIRTGEAQTAGTANLTAFKTAVCNNFGWLQSDCSNNLYVDVRTFSSFTSVTDPQPLANGTFNPGNLQFNPKCQSVIVVVRAYYQWPLIAPLMSQALQSVNGGKVLLTSTSAFRSEPYGVSC